MDRDLFSYNPGISIRAAMSTGFVKDWLSRESFINRIEFRRISRLRMHTKTSLRLGEFCKRIRKLDECLRKEGDWSNAPPYQDFI